MGIWAEIKHALNSTLGTSEFKPLDELIRFEGKNFAVGEEIFATMSASGTSTVPANGTRGETVTLCSFRPKVGGSFVIQTGLYFSGTSSNGYYAYGHVYLVINNTLAGASTYAGYLYGSEQATSQAVSMTVNFEAGDEIKVMMYCTSSNSGSKIAPQVTCRYVNILAKVVDNLIDIL